MKIIEKAIAKAVSLYGGDILSKKDVFCILLDDMTPEQVMYDGRKIFFHSPIVDS